MFEHLDDDRPFVAGPELQARVVQQGRRLRRVRRLVTAAVSAVTAVAVLTAAVAGYGAWRVSHVSRLVVGRSTLRTVPTDAPFEVLMAGVDRPSPPGVQGTRADTILVARIDPRAAQVTILSIPRDDWVQIPAADGGTGGQDRIGNAFDRGGADLLARTVEADLGLPISHVVVVDMAGLPALVDALGGVHVQIDAPLRDAYSGLDLPAPGCALLDGRQVLALVRSRHLELQTAAGWRFDPMSDLGRQLRVQVVLRALGSRLSQVGADPAALPGLLGTFLDHVAVDQGLSVTELLRIAHLLVDLGPGSVRFAALPLQPGVVNGGDVLVDTPGTAAFLHSFGLGAALPTPPPPAGIGSSPAPPCRA